MSGMPIDLTDMNLGVIHQPRIRDFINNKIDITNFSHPFLFDKEMLSNKKDSIDSLIDGLGRLGFLIIYSEILTIASDDGSILDMLSDSLKFIYKTDNVLIAKTIGKIVIDGSIVIGDTEFEFISDLVLEMMRMDKEAMKKKIREMHKEKEEDELADIFERKRREYERRLREQKNKDKEFTIVDMVNVVVHSQTIIDYEKAFDMTMYQLRNSYETLIKKESFNVNLMHRISPNFKPSEEFNLWEETAQIVRSGLSPTD